MMFSPQYIPIDPIQTTINAGVAIVFGHSKERAAEIAKTKVKSKKVKEKEQEESLEDLEVMKQEEPPKPLSKAEARKAAKEQAKADAKAAKKAEKERPRPMLKLPKAAKAGGVAVGAAEQQQPVQQVRAQQASVR